MISTENTVTEVEKAIDILLKTGKRVELHADSGITSHRLTGDGSNRKFWRLATEKGPLCIVLAPENTSTVGLQEAESAWCIGTHLRNVNVPVPEIYGYDRKSGILVCEDLGDIHLHQRAVSTDFDNAIEVESLRHLYHQALQALSDMQCNGIQDFKEEWCWDTQRYDQPLMLKRESNYFLEAFWQDLLGQQTPPELQEEFLQLSEIAAEEPSDYFLHRDYQSRNLMVTNGAIRIIDFQGGRFGPLAYDLASLLIDPYAALPGWFQDELRTYYMTQTGVKGEIEGINFDRSYTALSLQRNLQILGAFAYLYTIRKKGFFSQYLQPAAATLKTTLEQNSHLQLPVLTDIAQKTGHLLSV